ncbi:MAG: hypothetical protein R6U10_04595 [Thermoplasmatota archaeon]
MNSKTLQLSVVIAVAALLVVPAIAVNPVQASSSNGEREVTVNCSLVNDNTKAASAEKTISMSEAQKLSSEWDRAKNAFETLYEEDDETTDADREEARRIIENVIDMMQQMGILPDTALMRKLLRNLLMPSHTMDILGPVVSVGKGRTWIPLYPGEAFIGMMLRPIFVMYPFMGYTASLNAQLIPPRLNYWDLVGPQVFMTWGFTGIFINFAKIGVGVPNTNFMLGYSAATAGISLL